MCWNSILIMSNQNCIPGSKPPDVQRLVTYCKRICNRKCSPFDFSGEFETKHYWSVDVTSSNCCNITINVALNCFRWKEWFMWSQLHTKLFGWFSFSSPFNLSFDHTECSTEFLSWIRCFCFHKCWVCKWKCLISKCIRVSKFI